MQGVTNNFHTDVFTSLIKKVEEVVGFEYWGRTSDEKRTGLRVRGGKGGSDVVPNAVDPASFRVLGDHARAVAFLLADGVFPSNEGRGYVLRRILRRAVRHAWLLGRKEPTLVYVVQAVIDSMGGVYPELVQRARHIVDTTRLEEQGFLSTIEGGLTRFEQLAPMLTTEGSPDIRGTISGEDAFRLYDTYGFPIDLTELMARERGYTVDIAGFEQALEMQRRRSQEERKARKLTVEADALADLGQWQVSPDETLAESRFVGYDVIEIESQVTAVRHLSDGRLALMLRESPFYAESGGQVSDLGEITGDGWRVEVEEVRKVEGRPAAVGKLTGKFHFGRVVARVPSDKRRDTERNHTATHLLHAALRQVLGDQVHQAGSLVAPERLRFDFTHHGPVRSDRLGQIEEIVNREILLGVPVSFSEMPFQQARDAGAMALFGEKYGDVVRVVSIPGFSMELCGGTHVRNTAQIGLFKIVAETGVAAGVRRIEAVTGPGAYDYTRGHERALQRLAETLKVPLDNVERRVIALIDERKQLERRLDDAMRGGGDQLHALLSRATSLAGGKPGEANGGPRFVGGVVRAVDLKELQAMGDALREQLHSGVGVLAASFEDGKNTMLAVVTDDLRNRGLRADVLIREIAAIAGGRGGGKPHMAQAGVPDATRFDEALRRAPELARQLLENTKE
jgi:alanyl-tRNA synthetase